MEEMIDNYLLGLLSEAETKAFELRIASDDKLAREVTIQRDLMQAAKLQGLKLEINNAYRKVRMGKMLKTAFITTLLAALVGLGIFYITQNKKPKIDTTEVGASLPNNLFEIDNTKDTVIETPSGLIFHIPANAFGDIGSYDLEIKEALDALDIMETGLSTMSDSNLLATAGMFKITASKDGVELQLADGKQITAQVPTDEVDPDIMLFDGVEDSTGNVNWVNPKKIKNYLVNRSFDDLNFYPPGYLAKVAENGYDEGNKQFTDSLYWSFDCGVRGEYYNIPTTSMTISANRVSLTTMKRADGSLDTIFYKPLEAHEYDTVYEESQYQVPNSESDIKQICPASIKALQTKRFAKTYIATKEFEQRLQHLFEICDETSLDIYIANLDKDICYADSIVASRMSGSKKEIFQRFAAQKLGNTEKANPAFAKLAAYHKKKKDAFDQAAKRARDKVLSKYAKADADKEVRDLKQAADENKDRIDNYHKELNTNMVEAYRQAGLPYPSPPLPKGTYIIPITTMGWKNLDKYVLESTTTRTSLKTTYNGKDISIEYHPLSVQIENEDNFDFVRVYLIPDKLPSFQKVNKKGIFYKETLNELFDYELVCVAQKDGAYYFYQSELAKNPGSKFISLMPKSRKEVQRLLQKYNKSTSARSLSDELEYEAETFLYNKDLKKRQKKEAFRREIEEVIWPCLDGKVSCAEAIVEEGEKLFAANCASCHNLNNKLIGPALAGIVDKYEEDYQWLIAFTKNNQKLIKSGDDRANAIYKEYNGAPMNVFENLSDDQILSIYSYIDCMSGSATPRGPMPGASEPTILKIVENDSKDPALSDTTEPITLSIPIIPFDITQRDTIPQTSPNTFPTQTNLFAHLMTEYPAFYNQLEQDFDLKDSTFHASFRVIHCNLKRTSFITASNANKTEQYEIDMSTIGMKARERKKFFELCSQDCARI